MKIKLWSIALIMLFSISLGCIVGNVYILIRADVKGLYSNLHVDSYDSLNNTYKKGK